ncbi:hypothetical protein CLF_111628 [Clonorchis sinensis]|uniref:Uncharacterized protein n=1 Tax=Clonorchis sinensis TaxID=79923 RepID=G7YV55_CLOSI|nr:hypothetical protein CLF_111628 [Clonorchis sinensis]
MESTKTSHHSRPGLAKQTCVVQVHDAAAEANLRTSDSLVLSENYRKHYAGLHSAPEISSHTLLARRNYKPRLTSMVFTEEDTRRLLHKTNPFCTFGLDEVHPRILKETSVIMAEHFHPVFRQWLDEGNPPYTWKETNVPPFYESDDLESCSSNVSVFQMDVGAAKQWSLDLHLPLNDEKSVRMSFGGDAFVVHDEDAADDIMRVDAKKDLVVACNDLPRTVVHATSSTQFKAQLDAFYANSLAGKLTVPRRERQEQCYTLFPLALFSPIIDNERAECTITLRCRDSVTIHTPGSIKVKAKEGCIHDGPERTRRLNESLHKQVDLLNGGRVYIDAFFKKRDCDKTIQDLDSQSHKPESSVLKLSTVTELVTLLVEELGVRTNTKGKQLLSKKLPKPHPIERLLARFKCHVTHKRHNRASKKNVTGHRTKRIHVHHKSLDNNKSKCPKLILHELQVTAIQLFNNEWENNVLQGESPTQIGHTPCKHRAVPRKTKARNRQVTNWWYLKSTEKNYAGLHSATMTSSHPVLVRHNYEPRLTGKVSTEEDTRRLLHKTNLFCTLGLDEIHSGILKETSVTLAKHFHLVFRQWLDEDNPPYTWKETNVQPFYKTGERLSTGGCRPIRLTSASCKMMERILKRAILRHFTTENLTSPGQHIVLPNPSYRNYAHLDPSYLAIFKCARLTSP